MDMASSFLSGQQTHYACEKVKLPTHIMKYHTVFKNYFKGTDSRDIFAFWWHVRLFLDLNRGRGLFFEFLGALMILYCKKCISRTRS